MDDPSPPYPAPRRPRIGLITVLAIVAFVVGIGLMFIAMRNSGGWFVRSAPVASNNTTPQAAPTPPATAVQASVDPVTLATRESALAAQLTALEARAATLNASSAQAAGQAGRAEAILIAFAARRAIDRGLPLGYLEDQLRQRFGATQPAATVTIIQSARQPVTIAALRQALDANADLLTTDSQDWLAGLGRELGSLVVLHDVNAPSPLPADRLARARRLLDGGQVEASLAEINRLPGAGKADNWSAAAQRYVDAHKALDTIEASAMMSEPPVAAPRANAPQSDPLS